MGKMSKPAPDPDNDNGKVKISEEDGIVGDNKMSLGMHEFRFEGEKIKKPREAKSGILRELSGGQFVSSMIGILILGLVFFGAFYYLVNKDYLFRGPKYRDPVTSEPISLYLEVGSPETDSVSTASTVVVSGKTIPDAIVAIVSPSQNIIVSANGLGEFSKVFPLVTGLNPIAIYAYDNKGNSKNELLNIYYTTDSMEAK